MTEGGPRGRGYIYIWLIHVTIQKKLTQLIKQLFQKKKKKVVNYHYLPVRMASSRTVITLNAGEDLG